MIKLNLRNLKSKIWGDQPFIHKMTNLFLSLLLLAFLLLSFILIAKVVDLKRRTIVIPSNQSLPPGVPGSAH